MSNFKLQGFSLIELMMVIAIMGILTMMALPSYQQYTERARFAEVIAATEPFKIAIAIALQTGASMSDLSTGKNGIPASPTSTKNLASIKVKSGIITATGSSKLNNHTYILQPDTNGSNWTLSGSCIDAGMCAA
jgi:type IV pilus assembly protein PilA